MSDFKEISQIFNKAFKDDIEALGVVLVDEEGNYASLGSTDSPDTFPEIKKTIAADDTPEQLIVASTPCEEVIVQANKNNLNTVYVGPSTVSEDSFALEPGNSLGVKINNANLIYVFGKIGGKVAAPYTKRS